MKSIKPNQATITESGFSEGVSLGENTMETLTRTYNSWSSEPKKITAKILNDTCVRFNLYGYAFKLVATKVEGNTYIIKATWDGDDWEFSYDDIDYEFFDYTDNIIGDMLNRFIPYAMERI